MHSPRSEDGGPDSEAVSGGANPHADGKLSDLQIRRVVAFSGFVLLLIGVFSVPLVRLITLSLNDELHSHVVLIPVISLYLLWLKRSEIVRILPARGGEHGLARSTAWPGVALMALGACVAGVFWLSDRGRSSTELVDTLSPGMFGFVSILIGGVILFFGWDVFKQGAFPLMFLIFLVPIPSTAVEVIESFFQRTSADAAGVFFALTGTPVLRDDLVFRLPVITIEVARECSGIRSSFVLLITSLLAGYLFLRSPAKRTILVLAVIPLGILRNGFRILTISLLCVHVDPGMIDSVIHRKGGPLFFLLSLVPFFLLLLLLRKIEHRQKTRIVNANSRGQGSMLARETVDRENLKLK